MQIIITRHGETEENKAGVLMGQRPGILSEKGKEQAKALATALSKFKLDHIYSSDLARTKDTTQEIVAYHQTTHVEFTQLLRETNMGELEGRKLSEIIGSSSKLIESKNGESLEDLYNRAQKFLSQLFSKHTSQTILLVGHNGINKALMAVLTGKSAKDLNSIHGQENTAITIIEIDENKNYKITLQNNTDHLA